jgi:hypothetical protein
VNKKIRGTAVLGTKFAGLIELTALILRELWLGFFGRLSFGRTDGAYQPMDRLHPFTISSMQNIHTGANSNGR